MLTSATIWLGIGFLGQGLFSMRFIIQWLHSERLGRSVVPLAFWYFSVLGGTVLTIYAIYRADPVFILGQGMGLVIYFRNLYLIMRERRQQREQVESEPVEGDVVEQ
jgi:lipid-A-disaccharide synthase-like uncharacterized protein